ncbi:Pantothenate synthetase [Hartmannibacter diazotrophicus]|uniref:Pantothenate synthetase n=1 Tax=Hartmannibacter diazotrophicus TaxID=1482074 RepID=A0A2C9D3M4_9HYPH|nr:pantoate--beta-alanine ligase [Hartmannibacter diazotrophicus]SON54927.1 Pantothenate synthetase [Hartmannibacter diazotrophicus]
MELVKRVAELREGLEEARRSGKRIGLVPTMGYLHKGHLELVRRAREAADIVVVTIFVNPLQFGPNEDFERYPANLARDAALLEEAGVDVLFAPPVSEVYPRPMQTVVDVPDLGRLLEGEVRPGHFAGVCTVVSKLFNFVEPHVAFFGEKDYQQLQILRVMVADLAFPIEIVGVPTVREPDGLACSSRNVYLSEEERAAAVIVPRALDEASRLLTETKLAWSDVEAALRDFIAAEPLAEPEVVALRHPETLTELGSERPGAVLLLLYVRVGTTRLLDNRVIDLQPANGAE